CKDSVKMITTITTIRLNTQPETVVTVVKQGTDEHCDCFVLSFLYHTQTTVGIGSIADRQTSSVSFYTTHQSNKSKPVHKQFKQPCTYYTHISLFEQHTCIIHKQVCCSNSEMCVKYVHG